MCTNRKIVFLFETGDTHNHTAFRCQCSSLHQRKLHERQVFVHRLSCSFPCWENGKSDALFEQPGKNTIVHHYEKQ